MVRVLATTTTVLPKLKTVRCSLLILGCDVITVLTVVALQNNIIAWHISFPIANWQFIQ